MPELPEVEWHRTMLEQRVVSQCIKNVKYADSKCLQLTRKELESLQGQTIKGVHRWGKQLWLQLDHGHLLIHLGMTGHLQVSGGPVTPYMTEGKRSVDFSNPRHVHLALKLNDQELIYYDVRRFGRIRWSEQDPRTWLELGPDPLLEQQDSIELFTNSKSPIKSVLLDQKFIAGLGNWMVDDVLCEAGIHPLRPACSLSSEELSRIWKQAHSISHLAVEAKLAGLEYPDHWLFHLRWTGRKQKLKNVEHLVIGGRSTFLRPSRQNKSSP